MNTHIAIHVYSDEKKEFVEEKIWKAYQCFEYVVKKYSRFDPESELSLMNREASKKKDYEISKELYGLIKHCLDVAHKSNGAFDPTIIDILELYGYTAKYDFSKLNKKEVLEKEIGELMKKRPSYKEIVLGKKRKRNSETYTYFINLLKNQRIDLGGCGKGYAIDLAYNELKPLGNFMIDAGGDIRVYGKKDGIDNWSIGLYDPENPNRILGKVELESGQSIACSGGFARKVGYFHHLINPKSGKPENKHKLCFIIAKNALIADTYATTGFIMGEDVKKILPTDSRILLV